MSQQIMIDIETLSSAADAAIVSIGACVFDLSPDAEYASAADTFLVGIDPAFYNMVSNPFAFTRSHKTIEWWRGQSKEARDSLQINQVPTVGKALKDLEAWMLEPATGFIRDNRPNLPDSCRVWANPPQFDLVILRNAAKYVYGSTNDVPWHYRQETCARTYMWTFQDIAGQAQQGRKTNGLIAGLTKHRADHDAVRQARIVQYIANVRRFEDDEGRETNQAEPMGKQIGNPPLRPADSTAS